MGKGEGGVELGRGCTRTPPGGGRQRKIPVSVETPPEKPPTEPIPWDSSENAREMAVLGHFQFAGNHRFSKKNQSLFFTGKRKLHTLLLNPGF